jgi:hypothetical protein
MKKQFLLAILFLVVFTFYPKIISAYEYSSYCTDATINKIKTDNRGSYSYDINSITVDGSNLVISGWGLINSEDGMKKIDNIAPKFSLKLEAFYATMEVDKNGNPIKDANGNSKYIKEFRVATDSYSNVNEKYYYSSQYKTYYFQGADTTPRDYTEFFYTQTSCSRPYRFYSGSCRSSSAKTGCFDYVEGDTYGNSKRGGALCQQSPESRNYLYINLNFTFKIPLKDIKNLINKYSDPKKTGHNANRIYIRLGASTNDSTTVYGNTVDTTKRTQNCIPMTLTESLSSKLENILINAKILKAKTATELNVGGVRDYTNQISIMASNAHPRATNNFNGSWVCRNGDRLISSDPGCSDKSNPDLGEVTLYQSSQSGSQGDYYIFDETTVDNGSAYMQGLSRNTTFRLYTVRLKLERSSITGRITGKLVTMNANQSTSGMVAYIPALWVKPTLVGEGTYLEIPEDTSCTVGPLASRCNVLDNTTTCPAGGKNTNNKTGDEATKNCCTEICSSNSGTYYCTNICNTSVVVTKDCNTLTDPQEKYCCLTQYKGQDFCAIYAEKDNSLGRTNQCDNETTTDDKFKYPTDGYGDEGYSNPACKISCEEIVKTTFQPSQSVRAGMGYSYPIQINGTRYCTAEYTNDSWKNQLISAGNTANAQYTAMENALKSARTNDNQCGNLTYVTKSPSTNCAAGETLNTSRGTCEKAVSYDNACSDGSYNSSTGKCEKPGQDCSASYSASYNAKTRKYSCPSGGSLNGTVCEKCKSIIVTTGSPIKCVNGSDTGNGCLLSHNACDSPYALQGSVCKKPVCSISGEDWGTAQSRIGGYLSTASGARTSYNAAVTRFNNLMTARSICDNYPSANPYQGSKKATVSYDEVDGSIQVSDQNGYYITNTTINGFTFIGAKTGTVYDIMKAKSKTLNISSTGYNSGTIGSYSGTYSDYYNDKATYYDFWNEMSTATNQLEFSKNYYVQRYTGALSMTAKEGYELGGRLVYTDFYQMSTIQDFELSLINLGPNLPNSNNRSINLAPFTCSYKVNNMIFPPEGDSNHDKYGNVAFDFRQISLKSPFPNRSPRENWVGKESLITSRGYEVYNTRTPMYEYYLDPNRMKTIRIYNSTHNYGSYDVNNPYNSLFLDNVVRDW